MRTNEVEIFTKLNKYTTIQKYIYSAYTKIWKNSGKFLFFND